MHYVVIGWYKPANKTHHIQSILPVASARKPESFTLGEDGRINFSKPVSSPNFSVAFSECGNRVFFLPDAAEQSVRSMHDGAV